MAAITTTGTLTAGNSRTFRTGARVRVDPDAVAQLPRHRHRDTRDRQRLGCRGQLATDAQPPTRGGVHLRTLCDGWVGGGRQRLELGEHGDMGRKDTVCRPTATGRHIPGVRDGTPLTTLTDLPVAARPAHRHLPQRPVRRNDAAFAGKFADDGGSPHGRLPTAQRTKITKVRTDGSAYFPRTANLARTEHLIDRQHRRYEQPRDAGLNVGHRPGSYPYGQPIIDTAPGPVDV